MTKLNVIAANMTELNIGTATIFFSFNTPVACHIPGKGYFRTEKKWSKTTSGHINKWLDGAKAENKPQEFFDNLAR